MKKIILSLIAITTLVSGCATHKIKDQIEVIGNSLGDVEIKDLRSMQVNGLLVAQGTFYNDGDKAVNGYYRCKFLDASNFQVGDDNVWELLTIYPNQNKAFKCQSTETNAIDFKIEFSNNAQNVTIYH